MRRYLIALVVVLTVTIGGAWWYFKGKTYEIRLTETQIAQSLDERFPIRRNILLLIEIKLSNPRVRFVDGSNRVAVGLDAELNLRVDRQPERLGGSVDLETGLRYSAQNGSFYLTDPEIAALNIRGVPAAYLDRTQDAVRTAVAAGLDRYPVHTLSRGDLKQIAARLVLRDVVVDDRELVITLGI